MKRRGYALGGAAYDRAGERHYALAVIDLDAREPRPDLVALSFLPHGLAIDPRDPCRAVVFEKKGPGAAVVDLYRPRAATRSIETDPQRHFYGHGAFSSDGALLYATEARLDDAFAGVLIVRDARSFDELGTIATGGAAPHDCQLVDEGRTLVVTNGGGPFDDDGAKGSVTYVDVSSGKILETVPIEDARFNAGHLATSPEGDLAVVSAPREGLPPGYPDLGAVTLRPRGSPPRTLSEPPAVVARMRGETLSVLLDGPHDVVYATHPLGDCLTAWRLSDGTWLDTIELTNPRGIAQTLDGEMLIVSHAHAGSVRLSALARTSRELLDFFVDPSFLTGSHVYVCPL